MPLRGCDFADCSHPAERDRGDCMICSSHRCSTHLTSKDHLCPSEVDDPDAFFAAYDSAKSAHLNSFLQKVDIGALIAIASGLRNNILCTLPAVRFKDGEQDPYFDSELIAAQMGGQNCHLDIHFQDGIIWIVRLRLEEPTVPPPETQERMLASEVNTLRFLAQSSIPVPKVYHYDSDRAVIGCPFVLMEKMSGSPLDWNQCSSQQRTKVMAQLVDVFLELEKFPLPATGSLSSESGEVGPFAQSHMFLTRSISLGPFRTLRESFTSILKHELEMIRNGELGTFAVDNYLTHLWRLEQMPQLVRDTRDDRFYLKHFDDKGDHILVDEHHNIAGIIDWEFASAECKAVAFGSPCMLWPVGKFYEGSNELSKEEFEFADMFRRRGRKDMAGLILDGRKYQRFLFFLGSRVSDQRDEFEALFQGLRKAVDVECIETYQSWRESAIAQAIHQHPDLERLVQLEQQLGNLQGLFSIV